MRIAVFGVGGVGGFFGNLLIQSGEEVVFIARGKHLEAIRTSGLRLESNRGDVIVVQPAIATDDPSQVGDVDVVIVAVKAWQLSDIIRSIRLMMGPDCVILPLLNGVEAHSQLSRELGGEHVIGGLCGIISFITSPGCIQYIDLGGKEYIRFGELDNHHSERVERLRQVFLHTGKMIVDIPSDIHVAIWEKFLSVTTWGGIGAATRAPIGISRSQPETRSMLEQAAYEICRVAQSHQVELPQDIVSQTLQRFDALPPQSTSSIQRDIMAGRPSELGALTGAVVRLGRDMGIETPVNTFVYHSLLPLERRARGEIWWAEEYEK
jgi:2-dehydropantoate 2-reductase